MRIASLVCSGLLLVACRGSDNNNTDGGGGDAPGGAVKIQDVQNDAMPPKTPVSLHNVVVTAIDNFGMKVGDVWVEEMEGGPFSGIHVFNADASQVGMLALGDVVDVTGGMKDEFALTSDTSGRTVTEISPAMAGTKVQISKTGSGTVPPPHMVDALLIGQMDDAGRTTEWEMWEGVLITLTNVNALGAPRCVGSACTDPMLQNFGITGVAKAESAMAAFPTGIQRNTCIASMTGVVDYFFDYLIIPRTTAEVTTGGTNCPQPEAACTDSMDNDGNGFSDCNDDSCVVGDATCHDSTATINSIDMGAAPPMKAVNIGVAENVCITAVSSDMTNFWVTKSGAQGPNEGLYVFAAGQKLPTGAAVGTRVEVIGAVKDFNNDTMGNPLRELNSLQTTTKTGSCVIANPPPAGVASSLTQDATGKPMLGTMVRISNVAVMGVGTMSNHGVGQLKSGGVTFESLPDIIGGTGLPAAEMGKCYQSIDGIWSYDVFSNTYGLIPTGVGTGVGTCN